MCLQSQYIEKYTTRFFSCEQFFVVVCLHHITKHLQYLYFQILSSIKRLDLKNIEPLGKIERFLSMCFKKVKENVQKYVILKYVVTAVLHSWKF